MDRVIAMLRADDDASIASFVANDLTDDAYSDAETMTAYLLSVRKAVRGVMDEIGLEFDGDLHTLILRSGRNARSIEFDPTPSGIRVFRLLDPTETPPESPRDRAIREHVRALESAGESTLDEFVQAFERDRLSPSLKSSMTEAERRRLFTLIHEAASSSQSVGVREEGETIIVVFSSASVHFEIEGGMSKRITSLNVRPS